MTAAAAGSTPAGAQVSYPKQEEEPVQRRDSHFGVGIGYAGTSSVVHEVFGEGTDAAIYVNQRLWKFLGARVMFGSVYLGSAEPAAELDTYLTGLDYFRSSFTNITMKFTYLGVGPSVQLRFFENHGILLSGSYIWYDVGLDLATLQAQRIEVNNKRGGLCANVTYDYWIGASWGLNAQVQWHWIDTTSDPEDLYHTFVRGDSDPQFVSFLVGVQLGYR
jgi:hypothetical protein